MQGSWLHLRRQPGLLLEPLPDWFCLPCSTLPSAQPAKPASAQPDRIRILNLIVPGGLGVKYYRDELMHEAHPLFCTQLIVAALQCLTRRYRDEAGMPGQ